MFWDPLPIEGTKYEVRPISSLAMVEFQTEQKGWTDAERMWHLACVSVFEPGNADPSFDIDTIKGQPYQFVIHASDLALRVNGLASDDGEASDPVGDAAGN